MASEDHVPEKGPSQLTDIERVLVAWLRCCAHGWQYVRYLLGVQVLMVQIKAAFRL